ncbi:MAG: DNA replication complex GINS family protein [Candidatus Aenigmarchaeota archaeon]|nr:DNA replication complex GINS family protein [Candidatus Aenigmarchaeota archaeon]
MEGMLISFEALREFRRKEKEDKGLTRLPPEFYPICSASIKKMSDLAKDHNSIIETGNMRKALEDIFELREMKIIQMALHSARGAAAPKNLLPEEKEFFDRALDNILSLRKGLLKDVIEGRVEYRPPEIKHDNETKHGKTETYPMATENQHAPKPEIKTVEHPPQALKAEPPKNFESSAVNINNEAREKRHEKTTMESLIVKHEDPKRLKIMFLRPLPAFMGTDELPYGPVNEGDSLELPRDVAEFLIAKGAAKKA